MTPPQRQKAPRPLAVKTRGSFLDEDGEPAPPGQAALGRLRSGRRGPRSHPARQRGPRAAQTPRPTQARLPSFLWIFLALPDTRSKWASFLSLPTSISSRKRKEQNRKCLRECSLGGREERASTCSALRPPQRFPGPGPAAAGLTLQRECVRCRGELMSLGVEDRSPSAADASEMTEGCREWQGLTLTAGKQGQLMSEGRREWPHLGCLAGEGISAPAVPRRTLSWFQGESPITASGSNQGPSEPE